MNNARQISVAGLALGLALLLATPAQAAQKNKLQAARTSPDEQFFIVSSADLAKQQIVLKQPTEVTLLVRVDDKTSYLSEQGTPLKLADLRAGDTVWAILKPAPDGPPLVLRIRKGPMTLEELHRRYVKFQ